MFFEHQRNNCEQNQDTRVREHLPIVSNSCYISDKYHINACGLARQAAHQDYSRETQEHPSFPFQQQVYNQKHGEETNKQKPHTISCFHFYLLKKRLTCVSNNDFLLPRLMFYCCWPSSLLAHIEGISLQRFLKLLAVSLGKRRIRHYLSAVKTQNSNFLFNSRK